MLASAYNLQFLYKLSTGFFFTNYLILFFCIHNGLESFLIFLNGTFITSFSSNLLLKVSQKFWVSRFNKSLFQFKLAISSFILWKSDFFQSSFFNFYYTNFKSLHNHRMIIWSKRFIIFNKHDKIRITWQY